MKALSQSEYGVIRSLYQDVYSPDIAESILDEFTDEDLDDLTDEYIEEQVTEFFEECLEEGLDIDIVEQTICESVDTELEILTEKVDPNEIQRRRDQSKDRLATGKAMKSAASKPKESPSGDRDAGAMARAKLKVSKQKVGSASPEKKASALSRIKGAVKKVGQAAKGGVGLAARAVGTAKRAGSAVKSAAKSGYERGKQGSGGGSSSSSSSDSAPTSSASGPSSSSSSDGGSSSSSSSGGGSSSSAPTKRKDGLLKRGLKKVVRGITKGVSAAAGAVKAGADSLTDRARKEDMNYNKELSTIKELYSQVCNNQSEEEIEEDMKPLPKEKMERQSNKAYAKEVVAARQGNEKETNKQMQRRIAMTDPAGRKAALKKEELEATGLFTAKEIEALVESENVDEAITSEKGKAKMKSMIDARTTDSGRAKPGKGQNVKDIQHIGRANVDGLGGTPPNRKTAKNPVKSRHYGGTGNKAERRADALTRNEEFVDEAMSSYDRNRKRAAQRAADRNAARAAGKTGVVPGVGYVTPRREKETYTDEKGTVRHKSGAKNEEFEQLDELSKGTMGSYVKKASKDVEKRSYTQGSTDAEDAEIGYPGQTPKDKKIDKRQKGIGRAVGKLTK